MIDRHLQVCVLIGADKLNPFGLTINFTTDKTPQYDICRLH